MKPEEIWNCTKWIKKDKFLKGIRKVTLVGSNQYSLGGSVIEAAPNKVTVEVKETNISATNPFGYKVRSYSDRELTRAELEAMGLGKKWWKQKYFQFYFQTVKQIGFGFQYQPLYPVPIYDRFQRSFQIITRPMK